MNIKGIPHAKCKCLEVLPWVSVRVSCKLLYKSIKSREKVSNELKQSQTTVY